MCSNKVNKVKFKEHVASSCTPVKEEQLLGISMHVRNADAKKSKIPVQLSYMQNGI